MIDNFYFNKEKYKSQVENTRLSRNQKDILLKKMREADSKSDKKPDYKKWTRAAAAVLAVALVGLFCYMGFSNGVKSNNIFKITANAAEIDNNSVIGVFSSISGGQFLMKDFENEDTIYRNKQGKVDYFNDYELSELSIVGKNIKSVTFSSECKGIYFNIHSDVFSSVKKENNIIYDNHNSAQKSIAENGIFSDYECLDNSRYTKEEFKQHSDGLYGEFCDSFTYTLKNPSESEQKIQLGKAISLVTETDRTDSEIDALMEEYCLLNNELQVLRAENRKINGESGNVSDEEKVIEQKLESLNNQMVEKAVDGAEIYVTVRFADGSTKEQKINIGFYESDGEGVRFYPSITFSLA